MKQPIALAAAALLVAGAGAALARSASGTGGNRDPTATVTDYMRTPREWQAVRQTGGPGSSNSSKVQVVTLVGDPAKPGLYAQLLKVAPHVSIQAHHHAGDRTASVLQGTIMFGYGPRFDRSKLKVLPAGSVYTEPSGSPHYAETGNEPAVALITGFGPTDTVYEDPRNDPMKKAGGK